MSEANSGMSDNLSRQDWRILFADKPLQSAFFQHGLSLYRWMFDSRWTILMLLLIGLLRGIVFLVSYAPADGADGADYYLYAAYIAGEELPNRAANVSPMYPLFIYLNYYVLGNFNLIIVSQFLMSLALGLIMYLGLRRYNAALAVLVALVVLGDAQVGILFNFASTEPLYIFFLSIMYALATGISPAGQRKTWGLWSVLLGILLAVLRETRTVARFLFVPVIALFALYTRRWQPILQAVVGFGFTLLFIGFIFQTTEVAQTSTVNRAMYARPLFQYGLLDPTLGPNSERLDELRQHCRQTQPGQSLYTCLIAQLGDEQDVQALYESAYQETLRANPNALLRKAAEAFHRFLLMSGQQYEGSPTPAIVQCDGLEARSERHLDTLMNRQWSDLELTAQQVAALRTVTFDFVQQMCPPWYESEAARRVTDYLGFRYRSLSRPAPFIWHSVTLLLIILIPWARRYWYPFLLAGAIWVYHAAVSAAVVNVQPRYVAVTNPMRAILIVMLLFIIGQLLLRVVDILLINQQAGKTNRYG